MTHQRSEGHQDCLCPLVLQWHESRAHRRRIRLAVIEFVLIINMTAVAGVTGSGRRVACHQGYGPARVTVAGVGFVRRTGDVLFFPSLLYVVLFVLSACVVLLILIEIVEVAGSRLVLLVTVVKVDAVVEKAVVLGAVPGEVVLLMVTEVVDVMLLSDLDPVVNSGADVLFNVTEDVEVVLSVVVKLEISLAMLLEVNMAVVELVIENGDVELL